MLSETDKRSRYRRIALYVALLLAVTLLVLDRTAAYLHRPAPDATAVAIYTTEWCPYCRKFRAYLDYHAIVYTDYDVETSFQGGMGFWALRGRGVPLVVAGPEIIYGYDIEKIRSALAALGYRLGQDDEAGGSAPLRETASGSSAL